MKRAWRRILFLIVLVYVGLCAVLYLVQTELVFHPQTLSRAEWDAWLVRSGVTEIIVERDGTTLRGYLRAGNGSQGAPTVLYFGGNAERVTRRRYQALPEGWGFAAFPYRGFGASGGEPDGAEILADALAIHDELAGRPEVDGKRIVTWGLSFGTGVAVHVARHRSVAGVVLLAPYARLSAVAQGHYPFMPVSLLFRHEVDPAADAPVIEVPLLALHGDSDEIIPIEHGRMLTSAWKGPVTWHERKGRGHNSLEDRFFTDAFATFLRSL